ncbi:MAG TPA: aquaporin, partial [Pyrinomonadaceae bacterium]|nr:aquaporin [Pyrinomonadaceae bacterium]
LGSTHGRAPKGFAPIAIGLCLTLIHLITIPVTNTSVNPARSSGPAFFVALYADPWPVRQLWLFWVAPILGALAAGFIYTWMVGDDALPAQEPVVGEEPNTTVVEIVEE